jgi:glycosidase
LIELAEELRQNGISLVLDFVFNHTSHEHEWAILAQQGSEEHQESIGFLQIAAFLISMKSI